MSITSTLSSLRYFLSPVLGLLVIVSVCNPVFAAAEGPIVIQVGERVETLGEFEHQFEMAMVLTAVREGVPNKSGVLISDLRERFLEARVTELLLLAQKDAYSLEISDAEVDAEMTGIIDQLTELYGNGNGVRADLSSQME